MWTEAQARAAGEIINAHLPKLESIEAWSIYEDRVSVNLNCENGETVDYAIAPDGTYKRI